MRTRRTDLQLFLVRIHLLQLVPQGLGVPAPVISLGVVELGVAEASLELLEGVTQLKDQQDVKWTNCNNILPQGGGETFDNSPWSYHHFHNTTSFTSQSRTEAKTSSEEGQNQRKLNKKLQFPEVKHLVTWSNQGLILFIRTWSRRKESVCLKSVSRFTIAGL